ncbi:MAG TPA: hypothetical protein VMV94_01365, partial [Phycisphaerae bacterium]|nr:hypothetical protein [Phycisphaerae bacterium]
MVQLGLKRLAWLLIAILIVGISLPAQQSLASARQQPRGRGASGGKKPGDDKGKRDQGKKQKKEEADDEDSAPAKVNKDEERIRWGQRRNETDAQYDKRYAALLKKVKQDKRGDLTG